MEKREQDWLGLKKRQAARKAAKKQCTASGKTKTSGKAKTTRRSKTFKSGHNKKLQPVQSISPVTPMRLKTSLLRMIQSCLLPALQCPPLYPPRPLNHPSTPCAPWRHASRRASMLGPSSVGLRRPLRFR